MAHLFVGEANRACESCFHFLVPVHNGVKVYKIIMLLWESILGGASPSAGLNSYIKIIWEVLFQNSDFWGLTPRMSSPVGLAGTQEAVP